MALQFKVSRRRNRLLTVVALTVAFKLNRTYHSSGLGIDSNPSTGSDVVYLVKENGRGKRLGQRCRDFNCSVRRWLE
ncbi:hypothetical protein B0H66DRAFT_560670 [Apodospora peruviana]|uniref:Uncharacterized protein n=1 Tax=Apodospora peruviana TaxID=516989 RepID=A0AAE0I0K6_9PEZI|nr:hypothetical protein B0H66DRAFT_560670 [Apodospora peruviana]